MRILRSRRRLVAVLLAGGLLPLALLAYLATDIATDAMGNRVRDNLQASATMSALYINEELRGLAEVDESFANRPALVNALANGDERRYDRAAIRRTLKELSRVRRGIGTAFLADADGRLVDIVPETPAIVGKDFSFRDWYKGVTGSRAPYVSEAYRTQAAGEPLVVAVAAPSLGRRERGRRGKSHRNPRRRLSNRHDPELCRAIRANARRRPDGDGSARSPDRRSARGA
jgi:hypothetical protein